MTFTGIVKSVGVATLLAILALGLAGCGRRGDLEARGAPAAKTAATPASITGAQPKADIKPVAPKRDFLLDPLL